MEQYRAGSVQFKAVTNPPPLARRSYVEFHTHLKRSGHLRGTRGFIFNEQEIAPPVHIGARGDSARVRGALTARNETGGKNDVEFRTAASNYSLEPAILGAL